MNNSFVFVGVDVGSSRTKLVVVDRNKTILDWVIKESGTDFNDTANICLKRLVDVNQFKKSDIVQCVSTGYGRNNVSYADFCRTEISCHAKGCFYYFPFAIDIIDIGGQDTKLIKLNKLGKRTSFKMNRKCAAGTGSFLEEMAFRLKVSLDSMNELALTAKGMIKLGSYCTVFSATEVLEHIRFGKSVKNIVKGIFFSVVRRFMEMDFFLNKIVITGGVIEYNPYLAIMASNLIRIKSVLIPIHPQLTGALGAALFAVEEFYS